MNKIDQNALKRICRRNDIVSLGIFGSYTRGRLRSSSDVDLLVSFSQTKSLLDLVRIEREFTRFFGRKADLLTEAAISPYLRDRIKQEAVIVYDQAR